MALVWPGLGWWTNFTTANRAASEYAFIIYNNDVTKHINKFPDHIKSFNA